MPRPKPSVNDIARQAELAYKNEDLTRAILLYRKALKLDKNDAELLKRYGHVLAMCGYLAEAIETLERACKRRPNHPPTLIVLAFARLRFNDADGALQALDKALLQDPTFAPALMAKVDLFLDSGMPELALGVLDQALAEPNPDPITLVAQLKLLRATKQFPEALELASTIIDEPAFDIRHRLGAQFIRGQVLDALGEYDRAFEAFRIANTLLPPAPASNANTLRKLWDRERFDTLAPTANTSERPVIIVGMPRSGTTLTEQILAAHPQVATVGEAPLLLNLVQRTTPSNLTTDMLTGYADEYLEYLASQTPDEATRVLDKHMNAEKTVGLVARMFPNARLIHCLRDAADCCLSAYFQNFGYNLPTARDLTTIAQHYTRHRQLMEHWGELLDRPILVSRYEELVAEPEPHIRGLLDHLGLDWDDSCMRFHESKRHINTASARQVRQPIHATSTQRWRHYEKHLGPLMEALGPYAPTNTAH